MLLPALIQLLDFLGPDRRAAVAGTLGRALEDLDNASKGSGTMGGSLDLSVKRGKYLILILPPLF